MPTDIGTMNTDKTVRSAPPGSGVKAILFGLDPNDPVLGDLGLDRGLVTQKDSRQLGPSSLAQADWSLAICSLFSSAPEPHHDAVSVIEALMKAGFTGELVVLAPPLLRPKMVENELRGLAKGIKLRLMASALPPLTEI